MKRQLLYIVFPVILLSGCAELNTLIQSAPKEIPLSESEVINGLKEALITGANNASSLLSAVDGYYGDELVKILLPEEASIIIDNLAKIPGGDKLVEDLLHSINRAAEDAAKDVAPIFINSIKQMTINDAFGILNGEDNAATQYLSSTSRKDLYLMYAPKIKQSTEKDILGGISAKDSWEALVVRWNKFASSVPGKLAGFTAVDTDLDDYLTNKALDGMFLKVEDEETLSQVITSIEAKNSYPRLYKVLGPNDEFYGYMYLGPRRDNVNVFAKVIDSNSLRVSDLQPRILGVR